MRSDAYNRSVDARVSGRRARHGVVVASLAILMIFSLITSCSSNRTRLKYGDPASADWLTPRSNPANTGYVGGDVANEPYTVLWSVKTGGVASCEPVVRDGLLFFSGLDRRVEVFELNTGERRFRKRFDGPVLGVIPGDSTFGVLVDQVERRFFIFDLRTARVRSSFKVATVSAPPRQLGDSAIVCGTWHGSVICYDLRGNELWSAKCEGPILSAPAIGDSVIYVTSGRSLFALRANDGEILWTHGVSGAIEGGPTLDEKMVFVAAADSFATALELESGGLVWQSRLGGGVFSTPAVGDEIVYFTSNDGVVTALNQSDGVLRWRYKSGAIANLSPTICGDYILTTSRQATITVLNAHTGESIWSDTSLHAQATTAPVVVGDRIILSDARRSLICLGPASRTAISRSEE